MFEVMRDVSLGIEYELIIIFRVRGTTGDDYVDYAF